MRRIALAVLRTAFFSLVLTAPLLAQQPSRPLRDVFPGSTARVRVQSDDVIEGVVVRVLPDTMIISPKTGPRAIPIAQMDSLWIRGTNIRSGTIIGAAVGAVAGMAFAIVAARGSCDYGQDCTDGYFVAIPIGAVLLGLPGALAGSLVGSLTPKWVLRFP